MKLVTVIVFSKIVGVICSLIMVLSGRSSSDINSEVSSSEDNTSSEIHIQIDDLEGMLNNGNTDSVRDSVSPESGVNKVVSFKKGVKRPNPSVDSSQSDISEIDEGYSSDDEAEGSALAAINRYYDLREDYVGKEDTTVSDSEKASLRCYLYYSLTESESEDDW